MTNPSMSLLYAKIPGPAHASGLRVDRGGGRTTAPNPPLGHSDVARQQVTARVSRLTYGSEFTRAGVMEHETARTRCQRPALITISLYAGPTSSSAHSYGAGGAGPRKRILRVT